MMSRETRNRFHIAFGMWAVAAVVALLIASGVIDDQGRNGSNHYGALPRGVEELSANAYLAERPIDPQALCGMTQIDSGGDISQGVTVNHPIAKLHGAYIACASDQTWNDHRPGSISFAHAMSHIVTSPVAWGIGGDAAFLLAMPGLAGLSDDRRRARVKRHNEAFMVAQRKRQRDEKQAALGTAYARGELSEEEFEKALDRLMRGIT